MTSAPQLHCTAFADSRLITSGGLAEVVRKIRTALDGGEIGRVTVFDDETGDEIFPDLSGAPQETPPEPFAAGAPAAKRVGRPKLGVVAREVTLLPRHWDWLATQPEGASAALRKLVEEARRDLSGRDRARRSQRAADRFMYRMAGDLPLFEDAYRAFYAKDYPRMEQLIAAWPADIRDHLKRLVAVAQQDAARAAGESDALRISSVA